MADVPGESFVVEVCRRGALKPLVGAFCLMLAIGSCYSWGVLTTYVTSSLRQDHPSVGYTETFSSYILGLLFVAIGSPVGGRLERTIGARATCAVGGTLVISSAVFAYLSIKAGSLWGVVTSVGVLFGFGGGVTLLPPLVCCYRWLPEYKGYVSGIVMSGYGGGAIIFDQIASAYANPRNAPVQAEGDADDDHWNAFINCDAGGASAGACDRAASMYLLFAAVFAGLYAVGILLLAEPPASALWSASPLPPSTLTSSGGGGGEYSLMFDGEGLLPDVAALDKMLDDEASVNGPRQLAGSQAGEQTGRRRPADMGELAAHPLARLEVLSFITTAMAGFSVAGSFKSFASLHFSDDRFLGAVGSLSSVANLAGRLSWGAAAMRFGWSRALVALSAVQTLFVATFAPAVATSNEVVLAAWTCAILFNYGGNFAIYPTATAELFGQERCGENHGAILLVFGVAATGATLLLTGLEGGEHGSSALYYILGGIQALGTAVALALSVLERRWGAGGSAVPPHRRSQQAR